MSTKSIDPRNKYYNIYYIAHDANCLFSCYAFSESLAIQYFRRKVGYYTITKIEEATNEHT